MTKEERERVINNLFYSMTCSSFAEGCEDKIMNGLKEASDEYLLKQCDKWLVSKPIEIK